MSINERWFDRNHSIALRTKWLKTAINGYKYDGNRHWAAIFGRILVGFLETENRTFGDLDLITPSPVYTGEGGHRRWDHVREILVAADREIEVRWLNDWSFDLDEPPALVRRAETPKMVGLNAQQRRKVAETQLRAALAVPDPSRVAGKVVAVFDDVFTGGWTLREEARALRLAGAARVIGITLARQIYTPPN